MVDSDSQEKEIQALMQEFDSVDSYVQAVVEVLKEGHLPDISDLDDRVAHLCEGVRSAPVDVQKACLSRLNALLDRIGGCESDMTSFQKALAEGAQK